MKKSRLHGALDDARSGAEVTVDPTRSASNNNNDDSEVRRRHRGTPRQPTTASPRTEELSSPSPDTQALDGDTTTLQTLYYRVKERCANPEEATTLALAQVPLAVQAMHRVVSQMHEASAGVFACPALLRAMRAESTTLSTTSESHEEIDPLNEQICKDATGWYTLDKVVGRGTFGRVAHGVHRLSSSRVAIKTYFRHEGSKVCCSSTAPGNGAARRGSRPQAQRSDDALDWKRVRQEATIMERVHPHPNVVRYFESFESPTRFDLVMELVDGRDLCEHLRQQPGQKLREKSARHVFSALCSAVASLHAQGIIHRDLKLENVLLEGQTGVECRPVLVDFGFSELELDVTQPHGVAYPPSTTIHAAKNFCGTPSYMAPEVLVCPKYSGKAADVWSLGVILYVLLCGRFPFQGASLQQLHQSTRNPGQLSFPKGISLGSQALVRAILIASPAKRPTAQQILTHEWFSAVSRPPREVAIAGSGAPIAPRRALSVSMSREAFSNWESGREMISDVLSDLYGLDRAAFLAAPLHDQSHRVAAFLDVATTAAGRIFVDMLREQQPSADLSHDDSIAVIKSRARSKHKTADRVSESAVEPAASHKQQLEQLIGLVKHSLRV